MRKIAITTEEFWDGEEVAIVSLLNHGYSRVHLRKPGASLQAYRELLQELPKEYLDRISLHDYFELWPEYPQVGLHVNSRNWELPSGFDGLLTCSCHGLKELPLAERYAYCFLSPIFNSISKRGYTSAFLEAELREAVAAGLIDHRVYALGGVCSENIGLLEDIGFQGSACLGDAWKEFLQ